MKRLFAVSGNKCAFPKCSVPLIDSTSGKVIGQVCHIKGRKPGSPRYDPQQNDAERHAFDNLVIMCPNHHDIIDADETSYTVERLQTIKNEHEQINSVGLELADEAAHQFIANIEGNTIIDGSVISTQHQLGGQVAHQIINVGPQPRQISTAAANAVVAALKELSPEQVRITAILGDPESAQLATTLLEILTLAGWRTESGINQAVFTGHPKGVILRVSSERPTVLTLGNWLINAGLKAQGELVAKLTGIEVIVGSNL